MDPSQPNAQPPVPPSYPSQPPQPSAGSPVSLAAPGNPSTPTTGGTNVLSVVGLVMAFIVPPIGLLLSITGLIQSKKRGQSKVLAIIGTAVSGVSIFIFGVMMLLIVTSFTGIQAKARDTERQTDIKALYGQVEAYYVQNNKYPTLSDLNDPTWRTANLKGLASEAFRDPQGSTSSLESSPRKGSYAYVASAKDGSQCDNTAKDCTDYTLTAILENGAPYTKSNLASSTYDTSEVDPDTDPGYTATPSTSTTNNPKDIERQTDIKATYGQVEAYYAQNGFYPTLANLNDTAWLQANMKGFDREAARDPEGTSYAYATAPKAQVYAYAVTASDGKACDNVAKDCAQYTLTATLSTGAVFSRSNLN